MADFNNTIDVNDLKSNGQDFYKDFKEKLNAVEQFPTIYFFKFIVKSDSANGQKIKAIFEHPSANFSEKSSSNGKYTSISIECFVNTAEEVIDYYKKVANVPDVMMM